MQHKRRYWGWILVLLLVLAWPLPTDAAPDFPEPLGLVNDFANVLGVQERVEIQRVAEKLWQSNGVELAIVTVQNTRPYDTETYAFRLFRAWGIGEAKADNGLLVLLNMEEREIRIEVGTGLEGYVTDAKAGRILDAALPELQAGRYGQGLLVISEELAQAVIEAPGQGKELANILPEISPVGALLLGYIGLIIFVFHIPAARSLVLSTPVPRPLPQRWPWWSRWLGRWWFRRFWRRQKQWWRRQPQILIRESKDEGERG